MIGITLSLFLALDALALLVFGIAYAILIYSRPFHHAWTWVSVMIGVLFTELGIWFAVVVTILTAGFTWWILAFPMVGYLITGLPMIAGQVYKFVKEKRDDEEIKGNYGRGENG